MDRKFFETFRTNRSISRQQRGRRLEIDLLEDRTVPAAVPLTVVNAAVTESFDTLVGTTLPTGWAFLETGSGANTLYTADFGNLGSGDTYSYGAASAADRAFGTLLSGSVTSTIGASFTNTTGSAITGFDISYVGEQWRLGSANRPDSLTFQYSLDATSLATNSGTWTSVSALTFLAPVTTAPTGAKDGNAAANRTAISGSVSANIANNSTFWIRWLDFNASGADDGLAIDEFSITPVVLVAATTTTTLAAPSPATILSGQTVTFSGTISSSSATPVGTIKIFDGANTGTALASTNVISGSGGPGTFNFTSTVVPPGTYTNLIAYFEPLTGAFAASDSTATPRSLTVSNYYPITTGGTPITQDFNSLPSTGSTSVLPLGWNLLEVGTGADTQHTAGDGGENSGNTYNYGSTTTPADRALGTLLTGSFTSTIGASFINNTGDDIASLNIAYTGEQWRLGSTGRTDSLTFEYSLDATSLNTGTWTAAPSLDFLAPFATTAGALDGNAAANRTALTSTISLLTIANNATFWIRWTDTNVTGSDDGLAVDDFSITPILATGVPTVTTLSTNPSSVSYGQSVTFSGTVVAQSGVATPSGRVEIRDGGPSGTLLATATSITGTDRNGAYSVTTSLFGAGTYSPRAYFVPDPAFRLSNSATTSLVVNPVAFTAGDVAVLQADEADNNSSFSILDINPTTLNQANLNAFTINGTTVDASLRIAGSFTDTGYLSLNNYGDKLVFTGITTGATTASVGTAGVRGVGTLSPTGAFAIPTTYLNGAADSTTPFVTRGATTINNGEWYITDQSGTFIDSQIPPVIATNKLRSVRAFGGTVYVAQQSATTGESLVATLAASTATSATSIAGLPTSTSVQDFYLIRSGDHGGQYDVLYVINNAVSATVSTINKFSLVGGTWTANGTYTTTFGGFSIAAIDSGEGAVLYVTSGTGGTAGNSLYKLTDTAGFNSEITIDSPSNAILYTASGTKVLKGVALAPQAVTIAAPTLADPPTTTLLTTSAVTLNGNILSDGNTLLTSRGFYLSTNPDPVANSSAVPEGGSTLGSFSSSFSGLTADTVYYYVAYATNSSNLTGYTPVYSFRTLAVAAAPTVATPTASAILDTTATLNATVTADGGAPLTARGFIYSLSNDPVANGTPSPEGGTSVSAYSLNISGLVANSTYYYVAYATNSAGTFITSPVQQFTTLQTIVPPTVTVQAATAVASTAVALSGNVTDDGFSAITQRGFVYSTSLNPTTGDLKVIVSGTTGVFSGNVVGLTPGTLYYYRAFATNSLATSYSATTNSFTTLAAGTFGTNSVVVLQTEPQASGAAALSIVEYLPTGAGQSAVQAVALPTTVSATGNAALTQSISATSEGYLTRSQNGAYLLVTGYNAATGTTVPAASIDRIVGRIDPTGVVDTTTRSPNNTGSANIRSAGSVDGASLYISGTQGISLITFGTQPTTSISISASNVRQATVFDNQLYVGAVTSGIVGVNKVGSGLPDSTATLTALSAGTNTTNNTYYFLDRDAAVPGVDELFVADGASGIKKYSFNGTAWTLMGTFPGTFFGIAIAPNGVGTDIYATTGSGGSAKGNQLVKITDSAAYNVAASFSTSIILATAASDKSFRGVTFAPVATTPFITSPTKTGITTSAATLGGNITVNGGSPVTNRGVVYSISNSTPSTGGAGVFTQDVSDSSLGAFTLPVSGLTPGATYFYQAYATNALGTAYTSVDSFTVPSNADRLAVTSQPAATTTYGTAVTFTVAAQDAGNVTATGYSGTATIAITGGTFAAGQTTTVSFVNGLASFTVFVNAGTGLTFSATSAGLTGVSSSTFVVQQKELTVTGLVAANKDYDGSAAATFTGGTLAGVIAADVGNVSLGTITGAFSDAAAGANKSVTVTAAALTGSASSNYVVSPLPTVANAAIAPKVTSVAPFLGPTSGYTVTVAGAGFTGITGASGVTFNGIDAFSYTFVSDTQLLVQTPLAQPTGTANVVVTVNGAASNPANFSQGVNQITYATATLTGPGSSVIVGQAVALTLTLSSPVPAATTFSLLDASNSNAVVGTIVVAANATVGTQSLTTLSVGAHSLVASYDGVATPSVAALSSNALSVTIALSAPAVDLFTVNGGPIQVVDKQGNTPTLVGQNSVVTQLLVTFNQKVSLDTNAFSIVNLHASVTVNTGTVAPSTEAVTVTAHPDTTGPGSPSQGYLRYYLTFSGPGVNSWHNVNGAPAVDSSFTTIKNGYYQLVTHLAQVHAGGNDLSGVAGTTNTQNNFWALFGSVAPNDHGPNFAAVGSVSLFGDEDDSSFVGMYPAFGHNSTEGTPPYTAALDVDLDGGNGSPDLFGATETSDDELDVPGIYSTFGTNWSF